MSDNPLCRRDCGPTSGLAFRRLPLAVDAVSSAHSKRAYQKALKDFLAWHSAEARPTLSRAIVQQYRTVLESASLAASNNLRLSAICKLATEAAENGLLDRSVAQADRRSAKGASAPFHKPRQV